MTGLRVWISRALDLLLRRRRDDRLAEEIANHLELLEAEHVDRGLSPQDARLAARRAFGGVDQLTETYREQRGLPRRFDSLIPLAATLLCGCSAATRHSPSRSSRSSHWASA